MPSRAIYVRSPSVWRISPVYPLPPQLLSCLAHDFLTGGTHRAHRQDCVLRSNGAPPMLTSLQNTKNLGQRLRSALAVLHWAPQYQKQWLRLDFVAGVRLAAYAIPVSLAYASLAGLPGEAGLYCYLFGGGMYAAVGTSRQM